MHCPKCNSQNTIKNGSIHNGKPKFMCNNCGRQFVENPTKKVISQETWDLVDKLGSWTQIIVPNWTYELCTQRFDIDEILPKFGMA